MLICDATPGADPHGTRTYMQVYSMYRTVPLKPCCCAAGGPRQTGRLFTPLPTKAHFTTSHVKLDCNTLYGLVKRSMDSLCQQGGLSKAELPSNERQFRAPDERATWWSKFFHLDKLQALKHRWEFG